MTKPLVGIIMGSDSDLGIMSQSAEILEELGIAVEVSVVSAHRTPEKAIEYGKTAKERGLKVIIAGAGGAAHLPGVMAALTTLPVIGVPIKASISIDGWDSILSILQMPPGIPVATVGLDAARNAGILAAQIIGTSDKNVEQKLIAFKKSLADKVLKVGERIEKEGYKEVMKKK